MNVDSLGTMTEPKSRLRRSKYFSSGNASSSQAQAQAASTLSPYEFTPAALKALEQNGALVLKYSMSRHMVFRGSRAVAPLQADTTTSEIISALLVHDSDDIDIFAGIDPDYHMLYVQTEFRTILILRPTENVVRFIKETIMEALRTGETFAETWYRRLEVNRKRKQQLLEKEGGSYKTPDRKLPRIRSSTKNSDFNLTVIKLKRTSKNIKLDFGMYHRIPTPSIEKQMKLAREKEENCELEVIFAEWKLSAPTLSALPLVPPLNSHLPFFYIVNPGTSQGNHIFGNMTTQQSFLVANSDLQSSSSLLYSKDGWLLLKRRELDLSSDRRIPRYPGFLLNPTTGTRIDLPSFNFQHGYAAFCTTTQGTPEVVIYVISRVGVAIVYMVRLGDEYWEEHCYTLPPGQHCCHKMILCGGTVYCFFMLFVLIFKLADLSWHFFTDETFMRNKLINHEPLEVKGKVVFVGHPSRLNSGSNSLKWDSITFFRMEISGDKIDWVEIASNDAVLDGRIWFIHKLQSFCVKVARSGRKMCWFESRYLHDGKRTCGSAYALHCLNLTTHAHCRLTADSVICSQRAFVDLGCSHRRLGYL